MWFPKFQELHNPQMPMTNDGRDAYPEHFAIAVLRFAELLTDRESNPQRRARKGRVVARKRALIEQTYGNTGQTREVLPPSEARILCVDLAFSNPFAPYELKTTGRDFEQALCDVVAPEGVSKDDVARVLKEKRRAFSSLLKIDVAKVAVFTVGGMAALALGGFLAAPLIGGALGAAAGLSGAAATSYGLALLGGGSLAVGGAGMSGGLWLITGVGAAAGAVSAGGSILIRSLATAELRVELAKLQVTIREAHAGGIAEIAKAQEVIIQLNAQRDELEKALAEERDLNDRNSRRIKDLADKIEAIDLTLKELRNIAS